MDSASGGNAYRKFTTQDHSRVVAGNVYGDVTFRSEKPGAAETPEDRCRRQLFVTFPKAHRAALLSKKGERVEGTCTWIQDAPQYQAWLQRETRLLWICGGPGKGKTMLSIYISEELERIANHSNDTQAIYAFCSSSDERSNTAVSILRDLISQIIEWRHELSSRLVSYFTDDERGKISVSSREVLWTMFTTLCQDSQVSTLYCILDGLDECDVESGIWLVRKLKSLLSGETKDQCSQALHLVALSRNDTHLRQVLAQQITINLDVGGSRNTTDDVEKFVVARVNELQRIEGFDEDMRQSVTTVFLDRADTSFLWVGFVMEELSGMATCTEIYETLESLKTLPKGLNALYDRMLLSIPSGRREKAYEILLWVTTALRPLGLDELADAVDAQSVGHMSPEQVVRDRIDWCGSFLSLGAEPFDPTASDCNWTHSDHQIEYKVVKLVHHSARDYLLDKNSYRSSLLGPYQINAQMGDFCAVQRCLGVLQQAHAQNSDWIACSHVKAKDRSSGLLHYAIYRWIDHLANLPNQDVEAIVQRNDFFSYDSIIAPRWFNEYLSPRFRVSQTFGPLYVACRLGIVPWVQRVLASAIERGEHWLTNREEIGVGRELELALDCAIFHDHEAITGLLLDYGADPASHGFGTMFKSKPQLTPWTLKRIRDCVTDIHAKDSEGETLLMAATEHGTTEAMIVLLNCERDAMAHINMRDDWENNILHAAVLSMRDSETKLRYLIERASCGALINIPNSEGKTSLHAVVAHGYTVNPWAEEPQIGKVSLRAHGYTLNRWLEVPFMKANIPDTESFRLARILLENGADANAVDKNGETPLYAAHASDVTDSDFIELLLDYGASVAAPNIDEQSFEQIQEDWAIQESLSSSERQGEARDIDATNASERVEPGTTDQTGDLS